MNVILYCKAAMLTLIKELLEADPFVPFHVVSSSGRTYRVPTHDHASFSPTGKQLVIWFDDDGSVTLSALHIASVEKDAPQTV